MVAIELNKELFTEISKVNDARLRLIHGNVVQISKNLSRLGLPRIDAVISSLPMALFNKIERKELIKNTYEGLNHGGRFIVCQYSLLVLSLLKKNFKKIHYSLELRNLPPYFVIIGEKQ